MVKQVACIALLAFLSASCRKSKTTSCANTVTMTEDSTTYTECGDTLRLTSVGTGQMISNCVIVGIRKPSFNSYDTTYTISLIAAMPQPLVLSMQNATSGMGPVGQYSVHPQDSFVNNFDESFNGKKYECSGGLINVTSANTSNVSGTYTVNVFNASETKVISGTFSANHPQIR